MIRIFLSVVIAMALISCANNTGTSTTTTDSANGTNALTDTLNGDTLNTHGTLPKAITDSNSLLR